MKSVVSAYWNRGTSAYWNRVVFIFFFHLCFFGTILRGIKTVVIEFQNMVKESLYPLLYNPLRLAFKPLGQFVVVF